MMRVIGERDTNKPWKHGYLYMRSTSYLQSSPPGGVLLYESPNAWLGLMGSYSTSCSHC